MGSWRPPAMMKSSLIFRVLELLFADFELKLACFNICNGF